MNKWLFQRMTYHWQCAKTTTVLFHGSEISQLYYIITL